MKFNYVAHSISAILALSIVGSAYGGTLASSLQTSDGRQIYYEGETVSLILSLEFTAESRETFYEYVSGTGQATMYWGPSSGSSGLPRASSITKQFVYTYEDEYPLQPFVSGYLPIQGQRQVSYYCGFRLCTRWEPAGAHNAPFSASVDVEVRNVAPTITSLTPNLQVEPGESFLLSANAFDPGVNDVLTYKWDLDNDGNYDVTDSSSFQHSFSEEGDYVVLVEVDDGDGGIANRSIQIQVSSIPEPTTCALALATLCLVMRRRS